MLITRKALLAAVATILFSSAGAFAQTNPSMTEQQRDAEKETYYARFSELMRGRTAESQRLAYDAGKEYLRRFEGDKDADARTVRKFVDDYQKTLGDYEIYAAYQAKNYSKTFELGRKSLKLQPENFFVLSVMSQAAFDLALAGGTTSNTEAIDYLRKAIKILEAGGLSRPDPFKTPGIAKGFLNVALGHFLKDQNPVEAAAAFRKAAESDSPYHEDPIVYHRLGVAILKGEFQQVSTEYNQKYGREKPSAEQQAALQKVLKLGDQAVDAYARAVALSTKPEQQSLKSKLIEQLASLYKSLHNNSDAGLNELITSVLSKPLP
jgi:hypothetical protein